MYIHACARYVHVLTCVRRGGMDPDRAQEKLVKRLNDLLELVKVYGATGLTIPPEELLQCRLVWPSLHLHLHLGFVHPLQDVALHQCLPLSSVCCFTNPDGSLLLCYVILPSSAWPSYRPLPSPRLPLCASPCPPIVL